MAGPPDDRSLGEVVGDIAGNIKQIVRAELQLARAELLEEAAALKRGLVVMSIGAIAAGLAAGFALLAMVYALMGVVPPWAAAAIVAGITAVIAALFVNNGIKRMQQIGLPRTAATIQESVQWAKTRAR
jgi:uncharacterized membrane protein YqjE